MSIERIYILADKFWRGETTLDEERELKRWMASNEIPSDLQSLSEYLAFTGTDKNVGLDESFDQRVLDKLSKETPVKAMKIRHWLSAAASVVIVACFYFLMPFSSGDKTQVNNEFIDTYENPEVAYTEVKKALMLMSKNMNEGLTHVEVLGSFHEAQNSIRENK